MLSCVLFFATPWTVACQASLSLGILQAGILEQVAISSSRGSSPSRDQTLISCTGRQVFTTSTRVLTLTVECPLLHISITIWNNNYDSNNSSISLQNTYSVSAIKKAEHQRIDAFELRCWRRLLRVPWTARRANQSILKEISPGCSLEGLMLKLKLQYFGHPM